MKIFKNFLGFMFVFSALFMLGCDGNVQKSKGDVLPMMYHDFHESDDDAARNPDWSTSGNKFREDILNLYELGYESLSLYDYANGNFDREKLYFVLTFDDGYKSCYEVALPVLIELEAHATIFLNTSKISDDPWRMTWEQVNEMEESGFVTAYSHMPVHLDVTEISRDEFEQLVLESCEKLEQMLTADKDRRLAFAYPYGKYNSDTYKSLVDLGFKFQLVQNVNIEDVSKKEFIIRSNISYKTDVQKYAKNHRLLNRPMYNG